MGFYDTTCMITGVNLGSSVGTAVVLLHQASRGQYFPISLGIHGTYDGFGSIDWVPVDLNAVLLTRFFSDAHRTGRFQVEDQTRLNDPHRLDPDIDIEFLLHLVERTVSCSDLFDHAGTYPPSTVLDGDPVVFAMIAQPVWDAIAAEPDSLRLDLTTSAFGPGADVAAEIYGEHLDQLGEPLRQFAAVSDFIASQPLLRWAPPNDPVQRFPHGSGIQFGTELSRRFVEKARHDYRGVTAIQTALDDYERSKEL